MLYPSLLKESAIDLHPDGLRFGLKGCRVQWMCGKLDLTKLQHDASSGGLQMGVVRIYNGLVTGWHLTGEVTVRACPTTHPRCQSPRSKAVARSLVIIDVFKSVPASVWRGPSR